MAVLIGTTTDGGTSDFFLTGEAALTRYSATSSGTVDTLSFTVTSSTYTSLKLAIYADTGSLPGAKLGETSSTAVNTAGTRSLLLGVSVAVTSGTFYWLGMLSTGGNMNFTAAVGVQGYRSKAPAGAVWPDPWGGADGTGSNTLPIAGEGTVGAGAVEVVRSWFNAIPFMGGPNG